MKKICSIILVTIIGVLFLGFSNVSAKGHHVHHYHTVMGLRRARHPKFKVNSKVYLETGARKYMRHSHAKVVGVYRSKLYEVNYRPKHRKHVIRHYHWLVYKQISGHLRRGAHVRLKSNYGHMRSAYATIIDINNGPAYMVNYRPTNGGYVIKNYKWLSQSELKRR
ncbi:hypothetical protein WR164_03810 [Philodulcilactobacillus myokoensis]|uniref:DUF1541 domain-containing protein n=1 Tax=Philodulcilactobacillus myokoensis TaxID=2929573 RepID=A0A9W6ESE3_9LACO|nr:DUF1541 domain-containing protein [Philodulcilactobacillus myokoensis]GLB46402.1 hypothetical protein WR164_03810 [Philodulcilactobacillus myokoensis]